MGSLDSLAEDAGGLRFETQDDALDYAREIAQRCGRFDFPQPSYVIERYVDGDGASESIAPINAKKLTLTPVVIPLQNESGERPLSYVQSFEVNAYGQRGLMFCRIGDIPKAPKQINVIRRLRDYAIRLEILEESVKFLGDTSPRPSLARQLPFELAFTWSEGKMSVIEGRGTYELGSRVYRLVQDGAQLGDSAEGISLYIVRNVLKDADHNEYLSGIYTLSLNNLVAAIFDESVAPDTQILDIATNLSSQ